MSLIVQKFGGTSLGNAKRLKSVAQIICQTTKESSVIAVVSAMSSYIKEEGTTSRLIQASGLALIGKDYFKPLEQIEQTYLNAIQGAIDSQEIFWEVQLLIKQELESLRQFLQAIGVIQEVSPRSKDLIIGAGERLSAMALASILKDQGQHSMYVNLSEIIPGKLDTTDSEFIPTLRRKVLEKLPSSPHVIPVVTGFLGFVKGGIVDTIGRGYTDFTASLIAAAKIADELQIWKEVDGIFTADPRKVESARVLDYISPQEASELTYFGSEVLHPMTMEQALSVDVPVRIKNTFYPEKKGTVIVVEDQIKKYFPSQIQPSKQPVATAVTAKDPVSVVQLVSNRRLHPARFLAYVLDAFYQESIIIDLISMSESVISCATAEYSKLPLLVPRLKALGKPYVSHERAIVSLVGRHMKHSIGTAGEMFSALANEGINIEMITQGASEINISCVIEQKSVLHALQVIHSVFMED